MTPGWKSVLEMWYSIGVGLALGIILVSSISIFGYVGLIADYLIVAALASAYAYEKGSLK
jgi:hypothetical protein